MRSVFGKVCGGGAVTSDQGLYCNHVPVRGQLVSQGEVEWTDAQTKRVQLESSY